jgi:hypothetical protein
MGAFALEQRLVHALLANDLVDAMNIFTFPVVLGGGKTLIVGGSADKIAPFEHGGRDRTLRARREIKIGETALNSPSKAEAARQERNDDDRESKTPNEGGAIPRVRRPRCPAL